MSKSVLRIGTRGSRLALSQTHLVAEALRRAHPNLCIETVILQTTGDKILDSSLSRIGGKGVFTREIELALLDKRIDLAVHSLKDLPVAQPDGLALGAITEREPPHDVLVARQPVDWKDMTASDRIGTSSLRRQAQVRARNPRVEIADLRGNVPTRIRKALEGEYTAIILAAAGVRRLELDAPFVEAIDYHDILPAPGQGSLGVQIREDDDEARELIQVLHHSPSAASCNAERALLLGLGGGCQIPLGTLGEVNGDLLRLRGRVLALDGSRVIEDELTGQAQDAEALGRALAERLLAQGACEVLGTLDERDAQTGFAEAVARAAAMNALPLGGKTVMLTRDEDADGPLSRALRAQGANPLCLPLVRHLPVADARELGEQAARINEYEWVVLTSARGVDAVADVLEAQHRGLDSVTAKIAAVGRGTARRIEERGGSAALVPEEGTAAGLLEAFRRMGELRDRRVLYARADRAKPALADGLRELGAAVREVEAYRTIATKAALSVVNELKSGRVDAVLFTSASAAEALGEEFEPGELKIFSGVVVGAMGGTTAQALRFVGITPDFEAEEKTFEGLVESLRNAIG